MEDFYSDYCLKLSIVHPEIPCMRDFSEVLFYFLANSASEVHVTSVHYHVIVKKKNLRRSFWKSSYPAIFFHGNSKVTQSTTPVSHYLIRRFF